ncbi:hypothetical protein LA080_011486 [Diaporthe eres]|uniref:Ankyrin repeat protein n=1 Tax=Diaporthe vaccinii TaxID=105482 RepID=A0ABR4DS91_9PEZI|nr:hypothetical protein LA080_011486 [Diaporthe eres]
MAADARDNLGRPPTELFCLVVEDHGLSTRDLAALAATCRKCYIITNPILYQKHLKETGGQAILWAVEHKRFKTITGFLENGADINTDRIFRTHVDQKRAEQSKLGGYVWQEWRPWRPPFEWHPCSIFTPLALAASLGHDSMVAFLVDHGADIEKPGKGLCACSSGENQPHLCFPPDNGCGRAFDEEYMMADENGLCWTPLHFAICRGHESTAMVLLGRDANPQVTCPCDDEGPWNALHTATRLNQRKMIDYLLDNKLVDINEAGRQGLTPLLLASYERHYSLADMYIDRGANINAVWNSIDGGWTVFGMACVLLKGVGPFATRCGP